MWGIYPLYLPMASGLHIQVAASLQGSSALSGPRLPQHALLLTAMIAIPDAPAEWADTLQDLEFLALTDSTFQYMLSGDQYGARTLFGGQSLICPGAALTQNYKRSGSITPSILELLSWHCLHICGHCPGGVPYSNPAVITMLKDNLEKKVNVALIPI